jgi:hypothetical protein
MMMLEPGERDADVDDAREVMGGRPCGSLAAVVLPEPEQECDEADSGR